MCSSDLLEDTDDPQAPDKALALIAKALEQDPDFALAWAGRSIALWKIWNRDKTPELVRLAEEASDLGPGYEAGEAVDVQETLAFGHPRLVTSSPERRKTILPRKPRRILALVCRQSSFDG